MALGFASDLWDPSAVERLSSVDERVAGRVRWKRKLQVAVQSVIAWSKRRKMVVLLGTFGWTSLD